MAWDYDVIIVGGGGAGLSAAIEAAQAGASCMVLEADTKLGGATSLSGGVFYAAGTSVQKERGIEDSADAMFDYVMALNHWALKPDIIRYVCDESGPTLEWLKSLGCNFPAPFLVESGVAGVPRGHPCEGAGLAVGEALINRAGALSVETAVNTRVERLLVEDGRVVGVHAGGVDLRAPVTLIATGGFGNNPEMREKYFPSAAKHGDWVWAVHDDAPFILGDGINMGAAIGAAITGHDTGLQLPTSGFDKRSIEAFLPPWTMVVNERGKRFMPEIAAYTVCGYLVDEQPNAHAFAIFDEPTLAEASNDSSYLDPYNTGMTTPIWEEATLRRQAASGRVKSAETLDDLAAKCGIRADALAETVRRYNADVASGSDRQYLKEAKKLFPVTTPPFYAVEVRAAIIGVTGAGLDVDLDCNVLDEAGRVIPGLLAAGETTGVLQGKRYAGGGFSLAPAIILGRRAGREAATRAKAARAGATDIA